jgi:hypothetical protein
MKKWLAIPLVLVLALGSATFIGCDDDEVIEDDDIEMNGDGLEDAGESIEEGAEETGEMLEEGAEETEEGLEDAGDEITD